MRFADPWALLLLVVPILAAWHLRRPMRGVPYTLHGVVRAVPTTWRSRLHWLPTMLPPLGMAAVVVALARPQAEAGRETVTMQARNIVVALDISSSMKAKDFQPGNRIGVAKATLQRFVRQRDGDLIGLVVFAGRAFLQAPLSSDPALIDALIDRADIGQLPDGTAIGSALALALNQLRRLPAAASCVVLITDGAQNTGEPTLTQATEIAHALGVRVHAIGLSSADTTSVALNGVWAVRDVSARLTVKDEEALKRVAERTGGVYARATNPAGLDSVLAAIDPLERREVAVRETRRWHELYAWPLGLALLATIAGPVSAATLFRGAP